MLVHSNLVALVELMPRQPVIQPSLTTCSDMCQYLNETKS